MSEAYPVEAPRSFDEFLACEALQRELDPPVSAAVPAWFLWELTRAGGICLAVFDGIGFAREPLGFVLAMVREVGGERVLRLVLYGVKRNRLDKGRLREGLLAGLRAETRDLGLVKLVWPFDPLESEWAEFLLEDAGARAEGYELRRGRGGEVQEFRALATIEEKVNETSWRQASLKSFFPVNTTRLAPGGLREPSSWNSHLSAQRLLFEIPSVGLSRLPGTLKVMWKEAWEVLEEYMDRGYVLVGLYRQRDRTFLVLERAT
jgi:predicted GNAT superfamily acetyltransferase